MTDTIEISDRARMARPRGKKRAARSRAPQPTKPTSPTRKTYTGLEAAYEYFNTRLFEGELPDCLITVQRSSRSTRGYFSGDRFHSADEREIVDEIALNPKTFEGRTSEEILSTLCHEMVHQWQHHFGKPSRGRYHNKEWAAKMDEIGLTPSHTGTPGGRRTGQQMSHYIAADGPFARACVARPFDRNSLYHDPVPDKERDRKNKTTYTCPSCELTAWAKPNAPLVCGDCRQRMLAVSYDATTRDRSI
jgi:hypothetical protein